VPDRHAGSTQRSSSSAEGLDRALVSPDVAPGPGSSHCCRIAVAAHAPDWTLIVNYIFLCRRTQTKVDHSQSSHRPWIGLFPQSSGARQILGTSVTIQRYDLLGGAHTGALLRLLALWIQLAGVPSGAGHLPQLATGGQELAGSCDGNGHSNYVAQYNARLSHAHGRHRYWHSCMTGVAKRKHRDDRRSRSRAAHVPPEHCRHHARRAARAW